MLTVLSCIATEHDFLFLGVAIIVCVLGSVLTMRLYARVRRTQGIQKWNWLFMGGVIGGCTIWSTHFLSMLGYQPSIEHAYDAALTLASLGLIIATTTFGLFITAIFRSGPTIEAGGAVMGAGIAAMHYLGMAAYQFSGSIVYDPIFVVASIVLGIAFGAVATNRIARPVTRFCKYGGAAGMILAIATMHFTAMGGVTLVLDPSVDVSQHVISTHLLMFLVLAVMFVMLGLGASTYVIDLHATTVAAERYRHLSLHDPLTALPNRAGFTELLNDAIDGQGDDTARVAVISIDLDRFKEVNDAHGHSAGDAVLRAVANRMQAVLQQGEVVARVGGDEFIALTGNFFLKSDAAAFAKRLVDEIRKPVEWEDKVFLVGCSIGIALFPVNTRDREELLAQADLAMYRSKTQGNNSISFYDATMDDRARDRSALAIDLRRALENGEFELYYQPQNDTTSREVIGFEVLLRWRHPTRGMVSPVEFIPIAEKSGLIHELGTWVLRTACLEAATWRNPLRIAVNVAPAQLADANLSKLVHEILLETGLPANRLELEITESGIIADQQHALHVIRQLKTLGVKIAMDDYGTGYSSLSTLQTFPFDKIKIDRALVDGVTSNAQSAAIVRSTIILAQALNIPVLAEGVETEGHMSFLSREGCLQVQGYLFGKPMPIGAHGEIIDRQPDEEPEQATEAEPVRRASAAA